MGELDAGHRPLGVDEPGDPGQRRDVFVVPDAEVAVSDPPVCGDGRGLDDHQRHPAGRPAAQVDQVPVVREPVPGDVLAHGGHHDPVAERHPADRERAEEVDLGHLPIVVAVGRTAVGCGLLRVIGHCSISIGAVAFEVGAGHTGDGRSSRHSRRWWCHRRLGLHLIGLL